MLKNTKKDDIICQIDMRLFEIMTISYIHILDSHLKEMPFIVSYRQRNIPEKVTLGEMLNETRQRRGPCIEWR